jgi:putrescine transport system ATP-binding protein
MLRLHHVTKRRGGLAVVDDVSLCVARGELFALLGPSGCGKSTLLRIVAGLEAPDAGRILVDGVDVTDVPAHRRPLNMMFQSYALFPHMSVERNIAFGLVQDRLSRKEIAARVADGLRLVQLDGLGARRPDQLSGGQKQRVALARALVKRPKLLLLDEPLAALDKQLREETGRELVRLQKTLGTTFLVVTHDQKEAMAMASRIGVMRAGKIAQIGSADEIYQRPASRYVAAFVGEINLFDGKVVGTTENRHLVASVLGVIDVATETNDAPGSQVTIAVRPELVALERLPASRTPVLVTNMHADENPAPPEPRGHGANAFAGTIAEKAYLGDVTLYRIAMAHGLHLRAAQPNIGTGGESYAPGDSVLARFAPESCVVLGA